MNSKNVKVVFVLIGVLLVSMAYSATVVTVDPADRLMNTVLLGEWNTAGNLESWTGTDVSGLTATGGALQGTGTAATPTVQKTATSGWPDLDFGYYDYLQIRIKVPSTFTDVIGFSFGTSVNTGFSTDREFTIPNASIVKDGNFHAYRLDLGLQVWYRDTLRDLQIKPLGSSGNGVIFYIDYVEVGDLPGDTLSVNTDLNFYSGQNLASCSRMESKHGCFWWSSQSSVEDPNFNSSVMGRRACRMMEESWQVYSKILKYTEPDTDRDGSLPGRYKVNHITWYSGFWMGGQNGFGYFNVPGYGLGDEGWGNPCPHEYAHAWDAHQLGDLAGGHWESHANVYQDARDMWFSAYNDPNWPSNVGSNQMEFSTFRQDHSRLIYADYRINNAIYYYPGAGNPTDLAAQCWKNGTSGMTYYDKLATLITGGASAIPDTVTTGLRHWPFVDFGSDSAKMRTALWRTANDKAFWFFKTRAILIPLQDKSGWYRSDFMRSPEKYAITYHQLTPSSTSVTVELQGMDVLGTTEGWRWSLAEVDSSDVARYSSIFSPGTQSWTLNSTSNKVYLVVVATPSDLSLNLDSHDNRSPIDKCADRLHYPYEVRLVNLAPATSGQQLNITESGGHAHSNGGGYVGPSANVASTAYVGPNARVLGTADVLNYARIEDYAVVLGDATVQDYAVVSGYAVVTDGAVVKGNAKVRDRALVGAWPSTVQGNAVVEDCAHLDGVTLTDSAIAQGSSYPWAGTVSGTAILSYDYSYANDLSTGVAYSHVPWGDWYIPYWWQTISKPRGLIASYRTEETDGAAWWDEFGSQHAVLRGAPQRVEDTTLNSTVLRLDGSTQYAVLDRSLCDSLAGSFAVWVKPDDNTDRPILFMGSSATKYLKLALNASAYAVFTISNGTTTNTATSTSTIPTGSWTHLAVTVSGTQLKIYVNGGTPQATTSSTIVPDDVFGSNDYTNADGMFVGRDWAGTTFDGDLEDVRFYNVAMTDAEVANEKRRGGDVIGAMYWDASVDFNGTSTKAESGIRNRLAGTIEASIYPHTSDNVAWYEGIIDSCDELDTSYEGIGFGLDDGKIIVRLDGVGFWDPGVTVTLNTWQKVTLKFTGSLATLYVNDIQRGQRSYSATVSNMAAKNFRIGYSMSDSATYFYYDGLIKEVRITDRGTSVGDPTPVPTSTPVPPSLTSQYPFEIDARDTVGSYNGTLNGGAAVVSDAQRGNVLNLDGTDDYVSFAQGVVNYTDITIGTWVKWNSLSDWARVFDFGTGATENMFLTCTGGYLRFAITVSGGGGEQQLNTTAPSTGVWKHVTVAISGNTGKMYVDGQPVATNTGMSINPSDFNPSLNYIGKSQYADPYLSGRVDDFRIYNYGMTDQQVLDLYNGYFGPTATPTNTAATSTPTNTPTPTITNTPGGSTTYNFVGVTTATVGYNAYACDVDVFPFAGSTANRNSMVEATNAQYTAISVNDTSRWTTVDPGTSDEIFLWVEMKINEDPATITNIALKFIGYTGGTSATVHRIYVKDKAQSWELTAAWIQVGTDQSIAAGADGTMIRSITSNFATYIDASGILTWGVYETRSSEVMNINYLEALVTH